MINKIQNYLNNNYQELAKYIVTSLNGIPSLKNDTYDSSYVDYDDICDALYDAKIIDLDNDDNDYSDILEEVIDEFYNNFKFISIKVVDAFEPVFEIKYSYKGIENSTVGWIEDGCFTPIEKGDYLAQYLK